MNKYFLIIILTIQSALCAQEFTPEARARAKQLFERTSMFWGEICATGRCDAILSAHVNQTPEEFQKDASAESRALQIVEHIKQTAEFSALQQNPENKDLRDKLDAKIREMMYAHEVNLELCILAILHTDDATKNISDPNLMKIRMNGMGIGTVKG